MKLINKDTDYAVRALMVMAGNGGNYMSAKAIASAQKIPYYFLRRVLQPLIKKRMVISREGTAGGVKLAVDPGKIRVIDLIRIYHENFELSKCMFRGKPCSNRPACVLRKEVLIIEAELISKFEKLTIKKLLEKK
jgi:Rrf2 family protein